MTKLVKRTIQKFNTGGQVLFARGGAKTSPSLNEIMGMYTMYRNSLGGDPYEMDEATRNRFIADWNAGGSKRKDLINSYNIYHNSVNNSINDARTRQLEGIIPPGQAVDIEDLTEKQKDKYLRDHREVEADYALQEAALKSIGDSGDLDTINVPETLQTNYNPYLRVRTKLANTRRWKNNAMRANQAFGSHEKLSGYDLNDPNSVAKLQYDLGFRGGDIDGLIGENTWKRLNELTGIKNSFYVTPSNAPVNTPTNAAPAEVTPPAAATPAVVTPPSEEIVATPAESTVVTPEINYPEWQLSNNPLEALSQFMEQKELEANQASGWQSIEEFPIAGNRTAYVYQDKVKSDNSASAKHPEQYGENGIGYDVFNKDDSPNYMFFDVNGNPTNATIDQNYMNSAYTQGLYNLVNVQNGNAMAPGLTWEERQQALSNATKPVMELTPEQRAEAKKVNYTPQQQQTPKLSVAKINRVYPHGDKPFIEYDGQKYYVPPQLMKQLMLNDKQFDKGKVMRYLNEQILGDKAPGWNPTGAGRRMIRKIFGK